MLADLWRSSGKQAPDLVFCVRLCRSVVINEYLDVARRTLSETAAEPNDETQAVPSTHSYHASPVCCVAASRAFYLHMSFLDIWVLITAKMACFGSMRDLQASGW